jgi:hypothetical protein
LLARQRTEHVFSIHGSERYKRFSDSLTGRVLTFERALEIPVTDETLFEQNLPKRGGKKCHLFHKRTVLYISFQ